MVQNDKQSRYAAKNEGVSKFSSLEKPDGRKTCWYQGVPNPMDTAATFPAAIVLISNEVEMNITSPIKASSKSSGETNFFTGFMRPPP